jgi:hypothetical protein
MQNELNTTLATEINNAYKHATAQANSAKELAVNAVTSAVRCGELLTEAKDQTKNAFATWLAANCPEIAAEVAGRFISGARKIRERGIKNFNGNQLLLFFCEEEAKPERPLTDRDPDGTNWLTEIARITGRFTKTLDHRPVASWTEVERVTFLRQVEPIVKLARELGA